MADALKAAGVESKKEATRDQNNPPNDRSTRKRTSQEQAKKRKRYQKPKRRKSKAGAIREPSLSSLSVYHQTSAPKRRPVKNELNKERQGIALTDTSSLNPLLHEETVPFVYQSVGIRKTQKREGTSGHLDLVIGLDFGTSYTKVVVQDNERQISWAIPFGKEESNHYYLPTRLYLTQEKEPICSLVKTGIERSNLKTPLVLNQTVQSRHGAVVVGFLTLVIQHAKNWMLANAYDEIGKRAIQWHVRLGIPARNLEDAKLVRNFQRLATAAFIQSFSDHSALTLTRCETALTSAMDLIKNVAEPCTIGGTRIYADQIAVVPELAAQLIGFIMSDRWDREEPKFMLVDIGGGTLDAAIFNVTSIQNGPNTGQRRFSFFGSIVVAMGAQVLHQRRLAWLAGNMDDGGSSATVKAQLQELLAIDSTQTRVLDDVEDYILEAKYPNTTADDEFQYEYSDLMWMQLIQRVRKEYDPDPVQWKALPLLFCGGGKNLQIYKGFFESLNRDTGRHVSVAPFELEPPKGMQTRDIASGDFHRHSVAYGLSFFDLAEYVRQSNISTIDGEHQASPAEESFISKDMI